jgi:DNA-binding NtrC family response regulator
VNEIRRILIVDDERVMTDYLRDMLRERYELSTASSAEAAMNLIERQPFYLVLSRSPAEPAGDCHDGLRFRGRRRRGAEAGRRRFSHQALRRT